MLTWDELPFKNGEDGDQWNNLMAKYQHQGCPGIDYEDICCNENGANECAVKGKCRRSYEKAFATNAQINKNATLLPHQRMCISCQKRPVEIIEDFVTPQCTGCNDRDAQRHRDVEEWNYYHS